MTQLEILQWSVGALAILLTMCLLSALSMSSEIKIKNKALRTAHELIEHGEKQGQEFLDENLYLKKVIKAHETSIKAFHLQKHKNNLFRLAVRSYVESLNPFIERFEKLHKSLDKLTAHVLANNYTVNLIKGDKDAQKNAKKELAELRGVYKDILVEKREILFEISKAYADDGQII